MVAADPGALGTAAVGGMLRRQGPWQAASQTVLETQVPPVSALERLLMEGGIFFPN